MGTIILHAGMGKAGSSSIQAWLAERASELRAHEIRILGARLRRAHGRAVGLDVVPYKSGPIQSNSIITAYRFEGVAKQVVFDELFERLGAAACRGRSVVLSAEALQRLFWQTDEDFLRRLEELATRHRVRVAYYVRPQHSALEAHWRQWGFRSGRPPSEDLPRRANALHYFDTYRSVARLAPSVSFEPRPFRSDLLFSGDPVADFAQTFLGLPHLAPEGTRPRANRGLPLEVVNVLRYAPEGLFWSSYSDNSRLDLVKQVLGEGDAPETEEARQSRLVLQAHAHEVFEPGNAHLIDACGWGADALVPAVDLDARVREQGLTLLDEFWEPHASESERRAFYVALDRATTYLEEADRASAARPRGPVRRLRDQLAGVRHRPPSPAS